MQLSQLTTVFSSVLPPRLTTATLMGLGMIGIVGCAESSVGDALQQSLEADPQLEEQSSLFGESSEPDSEELPRTATDEIEPDQTSGASRNRSSPPSEERSQSPSDESEAAAEERTSPSPPADEATASSVNRDRATLADIPADLKPYIEDLMALDFFSSSAVTPKNAADSTVNFAPNQPITRGQYAHWLLTANNFFYSDQPSKKIRTASASATPAFQDVPPAHPYFDTIQGLADAGLIPSALTGNATAINFRPDAPLTRESLVLWKVPLDIRTTLPTATVDAVKATWGFQDATEIEPLALRAVLADHQTGDFANILRAFGYTTLMQPQRAVTQAEAAATLWRFGTQTEGISAEDLLQRSQANQNSDE